MNQADFVDFFLQMQADFDLPDEKMEMFFAYIVNGSIAMIRRWAASDMKFTPQEVAELIQYATYGGINGMTARGE